MSEPEYDPIDVRVAALERRVEELERRLQAAAVRRPAAPKPAARPAVVAPAWLQGAWQGTTLVSRVGMALLLLGVLFLLKYSIDQGWITEALRVGMGAALGGGMLALGLKLRPSRPELSQLLGGGGIAALYASAFAAFQLYHLIGYTPAFLAMGGVTVLALVLSAQHRQALLSVVGTLGGLATPFLLYTDAGSIPALVAYTALVLTGALVLFLYRPWPVLLVAAAAGGWMVLGFVAMAALGEGTLLERALVQAEIAYLWLGLSLLPVVRALRPGQGEARARALEGLRMTWLLVVASPLLALVFSAAVWTLPDALWGGVAAAAGALYAALAVRLRRGGFADLFQPFGMAAALLLVAGALYAFDAPHFLPPMALVGLALLHTGLGLDVRPFRRTGHTVMAAAAVVLYTWLIDLDGGRAAFTLAALSSLLAIGIGLAAVAVVRVRQERLTYGILGYLALLLWFSQELSLLDNGEALVSMAWGLCGVALLVAGLRRDAPAPRLMGLGTIGLVVAKLLLFDLEALDAVWRILLFLGFGALLLLVSYFVPNLLGQRETS